MFSSNVEHGTIQITTWYLQNKRVSLIWHAKLDSNQPKNSKVMIMSVFWILNLS